MESNQSQSEDMAEEDRSIGPVVRDRVHLERSQEKRGVCHAVGQIEDTLPALERILGSATVFDKVLGIELVVALLLQHASEDIGMEDTPDKRLNHHHERQETRAGVGDQEWDHGRVKDDERHKDIVGSEDVKVLEDNEIPSEIGVVHVFGSNGGQGVIQDRAGLHMLGGD